MQRSSISCSLVRRRIASRSLAGVLVLLGVIWTPEATNATWAQQTPRPKAGTKNASGHGPGGGMSQPPGLAPGRPGVGPTSTQKVPATPKKTAPPATGQNTPIDPVTGLPLGYVPKPEPIELVTMDSPLMSQEEFEKLRKDLRNLADYRKALRNADLSENGRKLLAQGIRYRLAEMTFKDNFTDLARLRENLSVRDFVEAASLNTLKIDEVRNFRRWLMDEVMRQAEPLFQNNYYVRIQVATLLGELVVMPADENKNQRMEIHGPAATPLRKVLRDPQQPLGVKIATIRSLLRICRYADLAADKRFEITRDVLAELDQPSTSLEPKTHFWYDMYLVGTLGNIDLPVDLETRRPVIVEKLTEVLRDPNRHWHVRAEAAKALGRVTFDPQVNPQHVLFDLMTLARDMAKATQVAPKDPHWKMTFVKLYLAFQPLDRDDRTAARNNPAGLLKNPSIASLAEPPYQLLVPMVNAVLNAQPITAAQIQAVEEWLQNNKPAGALISGSP